MEQVSNDFCVRKDFYAGSRKSVAFHVETPIIRAEVIIFERRFL